MARSTPFVQNGVLTLQQGDGSCSLAVGTPAWFTWLAEAPAFAFRSPDGTFTAHKERAGHGRGGWYWKAYRRRAGQLRRVYLGQSQDLTLERLRAAAVALHGPTGDGELATAASAPLAVFTGAVSQPPEIALISQGLATPRLLTVPRAGEMTASPAPEVAHPHILPAQETPFIGRDQQLQALRARLLHDDVRLLVLTGPGGVGKTRLALHAAAELRDRFADGVFFVSLAPIADPALVAAAIAQVLGVKEAAGRPIAEALEDEVRDREVLLVLDNFEQVATAAPTVARLVAAGSRLKALVTSRAVLHLHAEHAFPVPPLALPDRRALPTAQQVSQSEAVQLFVARAQAARPDFALTDQNAPVIAELCWRLEGLPLAIELAAARLRALPLSALLARLEPRLRLLTGGPRDAPARQWTLRDTIAWSYALLDAAEQVLFRRLAILRGGTLDAIEAICCAFAGGPGSSSIALPPPAFDVLDGVTSLVEKSLLRQEGLDDGQPRYVMLETVREYALERLAESGETDAVRRRHALYYLALAEAAEQEWLGPQQAGWLAQLEHEHDNLHAALTWCAERGYAEPAFRLAVALWWFWAMHGHIGEGRGWLTSLLARFPLAGASDRYVAQRAQALRAAGLLVSIEGDHAAARTFHEEGLRLRRQLSDPAGIFNALEGLGMVASQQGDHQAARACLEEALTLAPMLGEPEIITATVQNLGSVMHAQGDHAAAKAILEDCITRRRAAGEPHRLSTALLTLTAVTHDLGEHDLAHRLALEVVDLYPQHGDRRLEALALAGLGSIATAQDDYAAADGYLRASLAIQQGLDDSAGLALVLERFAGLAAAREQPARSVRLAAASAALRGLIGIPLSPAAQARLDTALRPVRQALGKGASDEAWSVGYALSLDEAIAEALSIAATGADAAVTTPGDERVAVLTRRERAVAALIARGCTNRRIAAELFITEGTVNNHVVHILNKLGYSSRTQVAVWAAEHGLLAPDSEER